MAEQEYIISSDGTHIPVPIDNEVTSALGSNGQGYIALRATPQQIEGYYRAAKMTDASVLWASQGTYAPVDERDYNNFQYFTTETRYDQNYRTDPLDILCKDIPSQIKYIRERYEKDDPLVRGIIDVLTDLTAGKIRLEGGSEELRKQYTQWYRLIKVQDLIEQIAHEVWLSGNVIMNTIFLGATKRSVLPFMRQVKPSGEDTDVQEVLSIAKRLLNPNIGSDKVLLEALSLRLAEGAPKKNYTNTLIPISYAVLDPLTIEPTGYSKSPDYELKTTESTRKTIKNTLKGSPEWKELVNKYGEDFLEGIRNNKTKGKLPSEKIRTIFSKKPHYSLWGYVPGGAAISYMQLKRRLNDLGLNTVSQAISFIILVRVGSDKFPADDEVLKAVSKVWSSNLRKNPSAALFQPHTTQIEIISPPDSAMNLLSANVYDNPNSQIAQAYGINLSLITGVANTSGSISYSFASMAIRSTIRRIISIHQKIEDFLYNEHLFIGNAFGYKESEVPHCRFLGTGLENASELATSFQAAYDRGMPLRYYLDSLGIDFTGAVDQAKLEQDMDVSSIFQMRGAPTNLPGIPDTGKAPGTPQDNTPTEDAPEKDTVKAEDIKINDIYQELREG